ncbi:MAG: MFS transporter [Bacteroidota bacterium]
MQKNISDTFKATLLLGTTLTVMAGAIVAPALPQISKQFSDIPSIDLLSRLILTLPALFMAILAPLAGYFTDKTGRKNVLLVSLILYAIAGTSGLYLNNLFMILVGRAVLGIAVGGIITAVITLIGDFFEGEKRSQFMGLQAAFAGLGGLVFISLGGFFADIHWRMPFAIYFFALVIFALAYYAVQEPDISQNSGKNDHSEIVFRQNSIPLSIYLIYLMSFFSMIVFYMIPVQMPFMLNAMKGISNTEIGFAIAFVNLASVTTSLLYKNLKKRMKFSTLMAMVYFIIFLGYWIISIADSYLMVIPGILVSGFGFGLMMPNINLWLISLAPPALRGRLVGYLNFSLFLGMFSSPILIQPLIGITGLYNTFFFTAVILLFMSMAFAVFSYRRKLKVFVTGKV